MAWFDDIKSFLSSFTFGKNSPSDPTNSNIASNGSANNDDGLEDFMDTTWSCYWVKF